jgi:ketosteroid isomerase-like protein
MLRPVRGFLALVLAVACALGTVACGDTGPTDEEQVRATVTAFARATAAKDYEALCDRVLAPALIEEVEQIGLPCEVALEQGLGEVEEPRLTIGEVAVEEDTATVEVRTSAAGQEPSRDTLELRRVEAGWRISSLGAA